MHFLSIISSAVLAIYIVWESLRSPAMYRRLKQAVDSGEGGARARFYRKVCWFEGISAMLALLALGFDWTRLTPSLLELNSSSFATWWRSPFEQHDNSFIYGLAIGLAMAVAGFIVAMRIIRHRTPKAVRNAAHRQPRFLPDFSYLLPTSPRERMLFALVALSAGICEEVVFRAWLMDSLHRWGHLQGWILAIVAALLFGLAHYYQGVPGVLVTSILGLFFCGLYVGSGTLLVPIVLHTLVDLRWAVFPSIPGIAPHRPAAGTGGTAV